MPKNKLLLVDDEADITSVLRLGLEGRGFEVDSFNDPRKALLQFKPNYYNGLVIDVRMPGMSGFELAKKIWDIDANARIFFLSAFEIYENESMKVFHNFKTHCFIKKPIMPNDLVRHIENHLLDADNPIQSDSTSAERKK